MADSDNIIIHRIKEGDQTAFDEVFRKYYPGLCRHAFAVLGNLADAEDVVQHVFACFWHRRSLQKVAVSLSGYLHITVHNECLGQLRSRDRRTGHQSSHRASLTTAEQPNYDLDNPERALLAKLDAEIAQIPTQQRQALQLVHLQGHKYLDAAEQMGISVNSIKTHLKLAFATLRKRISR